MFAEIDIQIFQTVLAVLTGILIAAVSSWITVQLSMRRFRAEWLWKRKADAYGAVIEALHNSKAFYIAHMSSVEQGKELSKERDNELGLRARQGHDAIQKAIDMGSFLLSQKALDRLGQYMKESDAVSQNQDRYSYLDEHLAATIRCLEDIVPIAKEDLKAKGFIKT